MRSAEVSGDDPARDAHFMDQALELSRSGRFWASPNPHVGCVLVRGDTVVGAGFTQPAGGNHAEIEALRAAEAAGGAEGATAYVTLEPCAHQGRTGPCVDALIAANVARVVVAVEDPNPAVAGAGLAKLRDRGIAVTEGVRQAQAEAEMQGFLLRMRRGWGRVRLKVAASLDGCTAMASGESQWITGADARADVQRLRAESSVILTGSGTVLADDCSLTVRTDQLPLSGDALSRALSRAPLRVVLDGSCRIPDTANIFSSAAPTLRFYREGEAPSDVVPAEPLPASAGGLDLNAVLRRLGELGANEILVEAGPTLAAALVAAGLVDEYVIYMAPMLLGSSARPLLNLPIEALSEGIALDYQSVSRIGADLRIIAAPQQASATGA